MVTEGVAAAAAAWTTGVSELTACSATEPPPTAPAVTTAVPATRAMVLALTASRARAVSSTGEPFDDGGQPFLSRQVDYPF